MTLRPLRVAERRLRQLVVEYLKLAASFEAQLDYRRNVPIADVVAEVLCIWDDMALGDTDLLVWPEEVWAPAEVLAIGRFHKEWLSVSGDMQDVGRVSIEEAQTVAAWSALRDAAKEALGSLGER